MGRRTARPSTTRVPARAILAIAALGSAVALPAATSGSAMAARPLKAKVVAFSGHYTGTATLIINNGNVKIAALKGSGSGSLVGHSSVSGKGSAMATAQCDPFSGTGSIASKAGAIRFVVTKSTSTQGCSSGESGPVTVTFQGIAKAVGGSGKAKGAKGSLKFDGTLKLSNTTGTQSGHFTARLTGKLTL